MARIELVTRDGVPFAFDAEGTENLLDAAQRAGFYMPSSCRIGSCGACRVSCVGGAVDLEPCGDEALPDAARSAGDILLCRAHAHGDVRLRAPFDAAAVATTPVPRRAARVAALEPAGSGAVRLTLQLDDDPEWGSGADFIPGQFAELELPGTEVRRAYSIANTPNWDGRLEFLIRLQPGGAFSGWLRDGAAPGDAVVVRGPQGSFAADDASQTPRCFVAGGTGLAPMLSMLGRMAEFGDTRRCALLFGVNHEDELFALDRIDTLRAALPALEVTLCVWRPRAGWSGFVGTPADALARHLAAAGETPDVYVCGPPALIDAVGHAAVAGGVPAARLFAERFVAASAPVPAMATMVD